MMASGGYLLDTNIIIHLLRNNAIGQHIDTRFGLSASFASSMVSIVTIAELRSFAMKLGWGLTRRDALQDIVDEIVAIDINSEDILDNYAEIDHFSEKVSKLARPMGQNDMWIAATAMATGARYSQRTATSTILTYTTFRGFGSTRIRTRHEQRITTDRQQGLELRSCPAG